MAYIYISFFFPTGWNWYPHVHAFFFFSYRLNLKAVFRGSAFIGARANGSLPSSTDLCFSQGWSFRVVASSLHGPPLGEGPEPTGTPKISWAWVLEES